MFSLDLLKSWNLFRYKKWKATHPSEDPRFHSALLTCYTTCCCVNSTNSESKDRTKQLSELYKTASSGSDRIDSHSTENGTLARRLQALFLQTQLNLANDKTSSAKDETRTAGPAKGMKIVITSTADGDVEESENSPIRKSAGAYHEIDLRDSSLQNEHLEEEIENVSVEKKKKASSKKKSKSKKS